MAEQIEEIEKKKHAKRQANGFILVAVGAVLGFIGCVMAMVNIVPELHGLFLFGFTCVAIVAILAGLYLVFE